MNIISQDNLGTDFSKYGLLRGVHYLVGKVGS